MSRAPIPSPAGRSVGLVLSLGQSPEWLFLLPGMFDESFPTFSLSTSPLLRCHLGRHDNGELNGDIFVGRFSLEVLHSYFVENILFRESRCVHLQTTPGVVPECLLAPNAYPRLQNFDAHHEY